ncbi:shikimate dehydrogenase [Paractinoplanes abujensis]|uniref:Shikimate dehydrogenase n=1 Tax=Paractinoplanes abujensis TaxID=882441 RepID=A0A7W7CQ92_9ACTN|nr:shikimate dehydrogenase [Actinoplanes abujensis]MBB4691310.1 shikimate dehydrogenase [Actinoplanes abujensis]GID17275.1 shikimate dehydrogenase [Actinoplanes abujensis]
MRCGLIGAGIGTSLSPALHEEEGRRQGLDLTYELFDTADPHGLRSVLDEAERAGFAGVNITHPFKQRVIELVDDLSQQARAIGAVNTVVFRGGRRQGHNTDAYGFAAAYQSKVSGNVVQLGAGGAGAATAHVLRGMDAIEHLTVVDPDRGRREKLISRGLSVVGPDDLPAVMRTADGLVNATPVGMKEHPGMPLAPELLHRGLWVVDIVYMPVVTPLLAAARDRGLRATGGTAMCAYQAAAAFELLTGRTPDTARMLRHLDAVLACKGAPDAPVAPHGKDH